MLRCCWCSSWWEEQTGAVIGTLHQRASQREHVLRAPMWLPRSFCERRMQDPKAFKSLAMLMVFSNVSNLFCTLLM